MPANSSKAEVVTGSGITFGTSGFSAEITGVGMDGIERSDIDVSHLGTPDAQSGGSGVLNAREFKPGKLYDPGGLDLDIQYEPGTNPPINGDPETITLTADGGGSISFQGYVNGFNFEGELEGKWTGTISIKASGPITFTPAA